MLPPHDRLDLIAEVGEEAQGIGLLVGDARNQSRDQNLARHHASVQFIHLYPDCLPLDARDMDDIDPAFNPALQRVRRWRSQAGCRRHRPLPERAAKPFQLFRILKP